MQVNIATKDKQNDQYYRYKRDRIQVSYKNFNGQVTEITNVPTLAKQLHVTTDDLERGLTKAIKKKMALSTCKPLTFPGRLDPAALDDVLQAMIEKHILCPRCRLPEWDKQVCKSCGYSK